MRQRLPKQLLTRMVGIGIVIGLLVGMGLSPARATAVGCPTIRRGSPNVDCIRLAQAKLGSLGFMPSTLATGYFGSLTDGAVRKFQIATGLEADGVVGPLTWDKLANTTVASLSPYGIPPVCLEPGMVVCISKPGQKLMLFQDGRLIQTLDARFGDDRGPEFATVEGRYQITAKVQDEVSYQYNNTPMPFTNYFYGGQGIHFSYDFAGGDTSNTSHGCIRLNDWNGAASLFFNTPLNTPVFIWR